MAVAKRRQVAIVQRFREAIFGLALSFGWALASPAAAQTVDATPAPPPPPAYVAPQVEHLLGDWGGLRTNLENQGVYLFLDATAEFAGNVSGGIKQGATSANQLAFEADIDWQRLAGITGLSTHVIFVNRSGYNDSKMIGDNVAPVQEIFGAGGNVACIWSRPMPSKRCSRTGSTSPPGR